MLFKYIYYLLGFFAVVFLMTACDNNVFENNLTKIFDVDNKELRFVQGIDRFGGFGEGFTLEEYDLSEKALDIFMRKDSKALPENEEVGSNWKRKDWDITPIDSVYNQLFLMCLSYSDGSLELKTKLDEIKQVLKKAKVYYSFYYRPDKDNPQDVRLYVLDTQTRRVYVIESNI